MIPAVIEAWRAMVASRNLAQLESLLSPGATFYSPIVHTPQVGREITAKYLRAAVGVLNNDSFRYVEEWFGASSAVLEFEVAAEGVLIDGIDVIHWNDAGEIVAFKVMVRPLKAINLVHQLMMQALGSARP
ncbi:MAG: nuclear transport factor 2 family protein [Roseiarcus sp.]